MTPQEANAVLDRLQAQLLADEDVADLAHMVMPYRHMAEPTTVVETIDRIAAAYQRARHPEEGA